VFNQDLLHDDLSPRRSLSHMAVPAPPCPLLRWDAQVIPGLSILCFLSVASEVIDSLLVRAGSPVMYDPVRR
jgi:hypothetical protein